MLRRVRGRGTAETVESLGVSETRNTGAWEAHGKLGSLENPGRTEEETRELEYVK